MKLKRNIWDTTGSLNVPSQYSPKPEFYHQLWREDVAYVRTVEVYGTYSNLYINLDAGLRRTLFLSIHPFYCVKGRA